MTKEEKTCNSFSNPKREEAIRVRKLKQFKKSGSSILCIVLSIWLPFAGCSATVTHILDIRSEKIYEKTVGIEVVPVSFSFEVVEKPTADKPAVTCSFTEEVIEYRKLEEIFQETKEIKNSRCYFDLDIIEGVGSLNVYSGMEMFFEILLSIATLGLYPLGKYWIKGIGPKKQARARINESIGKYGNVKVFITYDVNTIKKPSKKEIGSRSRAVENGRITASLPPVEYTIKGKTDRFGMCIIPVAKLLKMYRDASGDCRDADIMLDVRYKDYRDAATLHLTAQEVSDIISVLLSELQDNETHD